MPILSFNRRLLALVLATLFAFSAASAAQAKHHFPNLEIDSEQLQAWCEKMQFKGKIKEKTKHKLRKWRWKYCEELLRNKEPVAVIEGPEMAQVHSYFTLDASGSTDPEGEILGFTWTQLSGTPTMNVNGLDNAMPQFYVARGSAGEDLLFELAVSDGEVTTIETISVSVPACSGETGLMFADCFTPAWNGITAWEFLMDGSNINYQVQSGHNENFIKWQILDSGSAEHSQVIDIQYAEQAGFNALPRVRPVGGYGSAIDMSEYAGGTVQFDVRVLDWGNNSDGLEFKVECFWPCESGYIPLEIASLNEWQHIVISVDELVQTGADLSNLDIAFQVYPIWDQQAGVHYQLDNIRWSYEPPPETPDFETFVPAAENWSYGEYNEYQLTTWNAVDDSLTFSLENYPYSSNLSFENNLGQTVNLIGGGIAGDFSIPAQADGMSFFVIPWVYDENFNFANLPLMWFDFADPALSYDFSVANLQLESFAYAQEGFELGKVTRYGFSIVIFGDFVETTDSFTLDNLSITRSNLPVDENPDTGEQEIPIDYASWNVVDYTGTTVVTSASDLNALYFSSEWVDGSEVFGVNYQPIPAVNLDGGSFSFDLFIPAIATQTFGAIGVYFYDENWNQAARSWIPLSSLIGDSWNSISFDPFGSNSFDLMDAGFNTAAIGYIDILFISAGSVVDGPLEFTMSNVQMLAGDGPGTGGGTGGTTGLINPDNWHAHFVSGAPTIDWLPFDNNLSLTPLVGTYDDNVMYINSLGANIDIIGGSLNATLEIPEQLAGKQIVLQTFFIDENSRYATPGGTNLADFSGLTYVDWTMTNIGEASFAYLEDGFNLGAITSVGIQIIFLEEILENESTITISGIELIPGEGDGSGGGEQPFRNLPVNEGWRVSNEATNLTYSEAGVSYSPLADADQLLFDIVDPENYQGTTFTFEIIASQEFIDSGAHLQPIAQLKSGDWPGHWACWIFNEELSVEGATYTCTLDSLDPEGNPIFDLAEGNLEMQIGLQAMGVPAGTITVVSWGVDLPVQSDIPVDSGWMSPEGLNVEYSSSGVSFSPTESNQLLVYELFGPANYVGATFIMTIAVSQEYLDSGASIQPFALQLYGTFYGNWTCWIGNSELTISGAEYACVLDTDAGWNLPEGERLQVGLQSVGENVAGTITISKVDIVYSE